MRLSTTTQQPDATLSPWAERLRQRVNVPLLVRWQGGRALPLGQFDQPRVTMDVRDASGVAALLSPSLDHLGRAYVEGHVDIDGKAQDIIDVAWRLAEADAHQQAGGSGWLGRMAHRVADAVSHTRAQDSAAIQHHYDVSNAFYAEWLDPGMVYSCAYFEHGDETLAEAQQKKIDHILTKLRLQPGQTLLDIGCGWGALVLRAASQFGARCVGITLSQKQFELATERVRAAGLQDRVEIRLQDYRDVQGPFDRVSSVGMFEHVGEKNYRDYFQVVRRCLRPQGLFLLHTIGTNVSRHRTDPWIARYIFPNSMLPSAAQIASASEGLFVLEDWHNFGTDYDRTLQAWWSNIQAAWPRLDALRYDQRFRRMWHFYLAGSMATFRSRRAQLWQLVLSPEGVPGGYRAPR